MAKQQYPLGRQVFSDIIKSDMVYVDKTDLIYELTHMDSHYVFLSRPRRFGKTLLVSTLEAYFQGRKDLFRGLAIADLESAWEKRAVLRIDLSQVKEVKMDTLESVFDSLLASIEKQWGITSMDVTPGTRLAMLVNAAYEQTGKSVVVLIDEYDSPLLNVLGDSEQFESFRQYMRSFYAPLKSLESKIEFLFITGISKFSQLSLFSELNNINNVSMNPAFATICGFTEAEIETSMAPGIEALARAEEVSVTEAQMLLKQSYDGYHFCWPSPDVYNPYSLLYALSEARIGDYWFETGTPTSLVELLKRNNFDIRGIENEEARAADFNAPTENAEMPVAFMYQAGYLTIKSYDKRRRLYRLGVPNNEVREGLFEALIPNYCHTSSREGAILIADLADAIYDGHMDKMLQLLRSFFAGLHHRIAVIDERDFQQMMFVVLELLGCRIRTEVAMASGRIDFVIEDSLTVYVVELKYSKSDAPKTAQEAINQINEKGYLVPWEADGRCVVKVGAVWSSEERTIAEGWIIE